MCRPSTSTAVDFGSSSAKSNQELIPDAGKVTLDPAKPWGRGLVEDIKKTVGTHWVSEMVNFNAKTVAVSLLMFITVVAPTLTFGAVYGTNTQNRIGTVETILATSWVGIFFALFSGMPVAIIGSTGPVLIMSTVIYNMAGTMEVPFLTLYAWVSIWTFGYTSITAFFDFTRYVRLATRFTDDIFALLIVSIFILNAVGSPVGSGGLLRYLDPQKAIHKDLEEEIAHDPEEEYRMLETAFLSIILGFATTVTIFTMRGIKQSRYFCNQSIRNSFSDFAVSVAVVFWTLIQNVGFPNVEMQRLNVPERFEPTFNCCNADCTTFWPDECETQLEPYGTRPWFADLGDINGKAWLPFAAAGPALLSFVLFYLDNGITWHLLYNPSNNLQHGEAYNYDLFLNGFVNMINGLLGLPWLVATTVPCIVHLNNLTEKDEKGKNVVQETRLTYLFSHLLLGLSLLFLPVLKLIPLPVLLGVFLFMGLSSMPGIQFWGRILLFFQQPSRYVETPYTKYLRPGRIHLYTFFQILFFCGVFVVQNVKAIAIIFPFMTLLCIPGRLILLPRFFEGWELMLLDGEEKEIEEWIELKEGQNAVRVGTNQLNDESVGDKDQDTVDP
jgi:hypothetical protein